MLRGKIIAQRKAEQRLESSHSLQKQFADDVEQISYLQFDLSLFT